jgi:hypothetical protein
MDLCVCFLPEAALLMQHLLQMYKWIVMLQDMIDSLSVALTGIPIGVNNGIGGLDS